MSDTPDWREMDTDVLDAPPGWSWTVDDELAHHIWQLTAQSREVGWGPEPPVLLESLMGFFEGRSMSDNLNSWYMTRPTERSFNDHTTWWQVPSVFRTPNGDPDKTDILYSEETAPHPLRSKLHSQQYTVNGGMFTYDFTQWQGRPATGMMRIPVPRDLLDETRDRVESLPFTETVIQYRKYRDQFADGPAPRGDFAHPHFAPEGDPTQQDFMDLFSVAVELMQRAVRMEP